MQELNRIFTEEVHPQEAPASQDGTAIVPVLMRTPLMEACLRMTPTRFPVFAPCMEVRRPPGPEPSHFWSYGGIRGVLRRRVGFRGCSVSRSALRSIDRTGAAKDGGALSVTHARR